MDPLDFWRGNDTEDRQGITEIRHVEGYLAYWDELRERHPNMLIDSCAAAAAGTTWKRCAARCRCCAATTSWSRSAISATRTASPFGSRTTAPAPARGPSRPTICVARFARTSRPASTCGRNDLDYEMIRKIFKEWYTLGDCYYGDFWPLTPYSLESTDWIAWQFDRPEVGRGVVQAFRRDRCVYESARLPLSGLQEDARYRITDLDSGEQTELDGRELLQRGLPVAIPERPGSAVLMYERL